MHEARIHGLGGQGVVLTAHLVGDAAVRAGRWGLSLPFFSTAIRGGLVTAYLRIDNAPIDIRCYIYEPHFLVAFDESLLDLPEVVAGLQPGAKLLINSRATPKRLPDAFQGEVYVLDADRIAQETLGRPILSTVMAGAMAGVLGVVPLESLQSAVEASFSARLVPSNVEAARAGFARVRLLNGS
jgi:pyruvate ferredoxin oxidoreductase gamma subunit